MLKNKWFNVIFYQSILLRFLPDKQERSQTFYLFKVLSLIVIFFDGNLVSVIFFSSNSLLTLYCDVISQPYFVLDRRFLPSLFTVFLLVYQNYLFKTDTGCTVNYGSKSYK